MKGSRGKPAVDPESARLREDRERVANWKRWGPYLSMRQWGTVREDYSADGNAWAAFPFDHAHLRAYRWGEDGLLGFTDRQGRLALHFSFWNERDPILKERAFGLAGPEGNHGEDPKDLYFFLDSTPSHSFVRMAYAYPQARFPYERLRHENRHRGKLDPEFELEDTGIFGGARFFDCVVDYAKAAPDDLVVRLTVRNRGPESAPLHVLAQLSFRNSWAWGRSGEGFEEKPAAVLDHPAHAPPSVAIDAGTLGRLRFAAEQAPDAWLFCDNDSNAEALWNARSSSPFPKDGFNRRVVAGDAAACNPEQRGTRAAAWYRRELGPGEAVSLHFRMAPDASFPIEPFGDAGRILAAREAESDAFHAAHTPSMFTAEEAAVLRQARAGLCCSKQIYHYVVRQWLDGDPAQPKPPDQRKQGRNGEWAAHLYNRDVISMPDTWEYPWYAAWDLAFHMLPFARLDPDFAKSQLELFVREWYMHPNGQIPAYEWNFSDVNPPVHAWAAFRVYKLTGPKGQRDRRFLAHLFQKLLVNFTWWVNRKDAAGNNLFGGGFLGLDNIGVFDRSRPMPHGWALEQADGTAWMAFYCTSMLAIAAELAALDPGYEDMASKFFEHFVAIDGAMNRARGHGLWDEADGFYYDGLLTPEGHRPLRIRSMVGVVPLFAAEVLDWETLDRLPNFRRRFRWFLENRPDIAADTESRPGPDGRERRLLAVPSKDQIVRILRYVLDEAEFLSPFGVRSLSRYHLEHPFELRVGHDVHRVAYTPGESDTGMFGGNSNWRGPIWFPLNWLLVESLDRYHYFYGDSLKVECPTGSGQWLTLEQVSTELCRRLASVLLAGADGATPALGAHVLLGPGGPLHGRLLFHEYFHGDTGRGLGAPHQTGWTALIGECLRRAKRGAIG
ncbi:MAG: glucosidase [Deltaproteobacteria bacterium]|nr:glucosidase [Deltaproteobacteria bacterium]